MTQEQALNILKTGANVFLTGAAGSGKTYVLNAYINILREHGISRGITASTGIAATHIGGLTIHSWSGIGIARSLSPEEIEEVADSRAARRMRKVRTLIIDEISMLDADRLELVSRVASQVRQSPEPFGGMQVVVCGDFFQLPPVWKESEDPPQFAYESETWKSLNFKVCYLHERHRHEDASFYNLLDTIRSASVVREDAVQLLKISGSKADSSVVTRLYSHNVDVDRENDRELNRLTGKEHQYHMKEDGMSVVSRALKRGCLAPEVLRLKKGAAVMFVKNNFEEGYVNGTLGKVDDFNEEGLPIVKTTQGRSHIVSPVLWSAEDNGRVLAQIKQLPLRLAWAITIHKSQGMTLDGAHVDLSGAFEPGMGYVALSRVRGFDYLKVLGLNETALEVHEEVLSFDAVLREYSQQTEKEFAQISTAKLQELQNQFLKTSPAKEKAKKGDKKLDTVAKTHALVMQGFSLVDIAQERGLAEETIMSHIEEFKERYPGIDLTPLIAPRVSAERLKEVINVFKKIGPNERGIYSLASAKEALGDGYSYTELRLARLLL